MLDASMLAGVAVAPPPSPSSSDGGLLKLKDQPSTTRGALSINSGESTVPLLPAEYGVSRSMNDLLLLPRGATCYFFMSLPSALSRTLSILPCLSSKDCCVATIPVHVLMRISMCLSLFHGLSSLVSSTYHSAHFPPLGRALFTEYSTVQQ